MYIKRRQRSKEIYIEVYVYHLNVQGISADVACTPIHLFGIQGWQPPRRPRPCPPYISVASPAPSYNGDADAYSWLPVRGIATAVTVAAN